jgi:hypothetical protein
MRGLLHTLGGCLMVAVAAFPAPAQAPPSVAEQAREYEAVVDWATGGSTAGERLRRAAAEFSRASQQFDRVVAARVPFDVARTEFGRTMTAWRHVLEALSAPEVAPGQHLRTKTREVHQSLDQIRAGMNLRDPFAPYAPY